jgi:hypothetical protein
VPLPKPELGLVVHYGFVWAGPGRAPPGDSGKSRPCLIVDVEDVIEPDAGGRLIKRTTYLPISHVAPSGTETAIPIPPKLALYLKLTEKTSYIYTSYAVEDDWPFDVEKVPGEGDRYDYGLVPPRLFAAVAADFENYLARHPAFVYRRDA